MDEQVINIGFDGLAAAYLLLIIPFALILYRRVPIAAQAALAVVRMTIQLLFVGFYLQVVFDLNNPWLNGAWLVAMIVVAEGAIVRGCKMRLRTFLWPLFAALLAGTAVPVIFFVGPLLRRPMLLDAQYIIPIGGMILGNCLRADIIGLRAFYDSVRDKNMAYLQSLAHGASLKEATGPYFTRAIQAALLPTIASMTTIGLVALPGMMTGVILGGADPMTAIQYQIAIMVAIFCGTAITVYLAILLSIRTSFDEAGILLARAFKQ